MAPTVTSVLDVRSLGVQRGGRPVVTDVSFSAAPGEVVVLMGASGGGKSTILRAIAGLDPLRDGTIVIDGLTLAPGSIPRGRVLRDLHRRVGIVFQFHHLFAHLTALENVCLAPVHVLQRPRDEAVARAHDLLAAMGVDARAASKPHELSGGEAQRVAIARALAVDPPVLLMDEPTASLDAGRRDELAATVRTLGAQGRTVVIATHDVGFAQACAHRTLTIDDGRVRAVS